MIPEKSTVVRNLTTKEKISLVTELRNNTGLWMQHPMNKTALDSGTSIILNWVTHINGNYQKQWTLKEFFPETWQILESIAQGKEFGKIYWHKLLPGQSAKPHTDNGNLYIRNGDAFKRYNIFLSVPADVRMYFDGDLTNLFTLPVAHTLVDQCATKPHAVFNKSNEEIIVMVIDVLNDNIKVYDDMYHATEVDWAGLERLGTTL